MGYTSEKLDWAIKSLKRRGHIIHGNGQPAVMGGLPDGITFVVDGRRIGVEEIYLMATPPDGERYQFQVDGKTCDFHYYFVEGGAEYEVYQVGQKITARQPTTEHWMDCAQRVCSSMGGTDLKRL